MTDDFGTWSDDHGFCIYRWSELNDLPPRRWLVKNLLLYSGLTLIVGASGTMKTFFAIYLIALITQGQPALGLKTCKASALYIAAEGGLGIRERLNAFAKHYNINIDDIALYILPQAIDLCLKDIDINLLLDRIEKLPGSPNIELIIVDTVNSVMIGGDENTPKDMGLFLSRCKRLREATGANVLAVHHTGKESGKGPRGHSSLFAAMDTVLTIKREDGSSISVEVEKQREGITGARFYLQSLQVDLGRDEDGDAITSLALEYIPGQLEADRSPKKRPFLRKAVLKVRTALEDALDNHAITVPNGLLVPNGVEDVVELSHWRNEAYNAGISKGGERAMQQAFKRAVATLKKEGIVGADSEGKYAWLIPTTQD